MLAREVEASPLSSPSQGFAKVSLTFFVPRSTTLRLKFSHILLMNRARGIAESFHLGEDVQPSAGPSAGRSRRWPDTIPTGPLTATELLESAILYGHPNAFWVPRVALEETEVMPFIDHYSECS